MRPTRALTLLELLVAVGIVSILATVAVVNFLSAQVRAKVSRARADLAVVVAALEAYRCRGTGASAPPATARSSPSTRSTATATPGRGPLAAAH